MTRITPPEIAPTDMMKLANLRARKLKTVIEQPEIVEALRQSQHMNYTIQEMKDMIENLIFVTRKEQSSVEN